MKLHTFALSMAMTVAIATPVLGGPGTPFTPPPASDVDTPYNTDRDAPSSHPSASVAVRCAPAGSNAAVVNGALVPAAPSSSGSTASGRAASSVVLLNGASVPTGAGPYDDTWCGGSYREDWGTNFGGR